MTVDMSPPPLTAAQRKAAERLRRAEAGLVRLELWAAPEHHAQLKALAEKLAAQQAKQRPK